jgi:radical SAM superfamily enzyme YgiQ (UPF0313 family)
MKTVFIFPPQWNIFSPSTGIPELMGALKGHGHQTIAYDLNIDFYDYVLRASYAQSSLEKAKNIIKNSLGETISDDEKIKFEYIKKILLEQGEALGLSIKNIEKCKANLRSKKYFYNPILRDNCLKIIYKTLLAVSLPYYPHSLGIDNFINIEKEIGLLNYNCKQLATDKKANMFIEYFEQKIHEILKEKPELIGISINSNDQMLAGLTFAKMLKERCSAHIIIGGTWVEVEHEKIKQDKELFSSFADSCIRGLGEISIIQLAEYIENKRPIKEVSGLIYMENNIICENEKSDCSLDKIHHSDYSGYKFKQYFIPEPVIPIRVSHGCYWGKCTFCDYNHNKIYSPRSVDDVISEIEDLVKKSNIRYFYFQDAALSPKFLEEFSDKIIKKNLKIRYFSNLRFEKEFNKMLLKQIYKSGMRIAQWGLESGCQKILDKMNKGIKKETALKILKTAYKIGFYNHLYLIVNFPGETYEDCKETTDFLRLNKKYIHSFFFNNFILIKNTYIHSNLKEFGIDQKLVDNKEFWFCSADKLGIEIDEKKELIKNAQQTLLKEPHFEVIGAINQMILLSIDRYPVKYALFYSTILKISKILSKIGFKIKRIK